MSAAAAAHITSKVWLWFFL